MTTSRDSTTLLTALVARSHVLTAANCRGTQPRPGTPPRIAADSPLMELFAVELAPLVPAELRQGLFRANSVKEAADWIAAAAMYEWVKSDADVARQFVQEVGQNGPRSACLAVADARVRRHCPHRFSRLRLHLLLAGLLVELIGAATFYLVWLSRS